MVTVRMRSSFSPFAEPADFSGVTFDDRLPEADLAVATDDSSAALADEYNRGRVPLVLVCVLRTPVRLHQNPAEPAPGFDL